MTLFFWVFASALILLAAAFIVFLPRWWQRRAVPESNADWLRLRRRELADSAPELLEEAALRVMEDGLTPGTVETTLPARYALARPVGGVLALAALVALLYVKLGSLEDVSISTALDGLEGASPGEISALIERIQRRAEQRPDNADYSLLLGEYHLSANEPIRALVYFDRLIAAGATSPDILGKAAQAEFCRLTASSVIAPVPVQSRHWRWTLWPQRRWRRWVWQRLSWQTSRRRCATGRPSALWSPRGLLAIKC